MSYLKLKPGMPMHDHVQTAKDNGVWACDAITHNSPNGCSNPDCFKYAVPLPTTHPGQTLERIRLQFAALFTLYVSTTRVKALKRGIGMATPQDDILLRAQREGLRAYVRALRTGVPCDFQRLRGLTS